MSSPPAFTLFEKWRPNQVGGKISKAGTKYVRTRCRGGDQIGPLRKGREINGQTQALFQLDRPKKALATFDETTLPLALIELESSKDACDEIDRSHRCAAG
jgi:hypothetical protein